jgi:hypothetical protein
MKNFEARLADLEARWEVLSARVAELEAIIAARKPKKPDGREWLSAIPAGVYGRDTGSTWCDHDN